MRNELPSCDLCTLAAAIALSSRNQNLRERLGCSLFLQVCKPGARRVKEKGQEARKDAQICSEIGCCSEQ